MTTTEPVNADRDAANRDAANRDAANPDPDRSDASGPASSVRLRRIRWAVRITLTIGVAASVAANILHAQPHPVSQVIAAWPPLALLLTVELISRVPVHNRLLGAVRLAATAAIAGIAAWVSYWHMAAVAARHGETATSAHLLPISVDGLVVVASISLVEITARLRLHAAPRTPLAMAAASDPPDRPAGPTPAGPHRSPTPPSAPVATPGAAAGPVPAPTAGRSARHNGRDTQQDRAGPAAGDRRTPDATGTGHEGHPRRNGAVPAGTAAAVAYWHQHDPDLRPAQVAARIGRSERTVRRHWPPARPTALAGAGAQQDGRVAVGRATQPQTG